MNEQRDPAQTPTSEDRLNEIAYQFISLYERWSQERDLALQQGAETAELVRLFTEQVHHFKGLMPEVRQQLRVGIEDLTFQVAHDVGKQISQEALQATHQIINQLTSVTQQTEQTLTQCEKEIIKRHWKITAVSALTTLAISILLVVWLIPKPTVPLSNTQLRYLNNGIMMERVWPKLSKKEQQHWRNLAIQTSRSL